MLILFPKRKGVKIATTLIFQAMEGRKSKEYVRGMIAFAFAFGAITGKEMEALTQHNER